MSDNRHIGFRVPSEFRNAFKAMCARQGLSIRETLMRLIGEWMALTEAERAQWFERSEQSDE